MLDVLGPLLLYGSGLLLLAAVLGRMVLAGLGRPADGAFVLRVGLWASLGVFLMGLALVLLAPP